MAFSFFSVVAFDFFLSLPVLRMDRETGGLMAEKRNIFYIYTLNAGIYQQIPVSMSRDLREKKLVLAMARLAEDGSLSTFGSANF